MIQLGSTAVAKAACEAGQALYAHSGDMRGMVEPHSTLWEQSCSVCREIYTGVSSYMDSVTP